MSSEGRDRAAVDYGTVVVKVALGVSLGGPAGVATTITDFVKSRVENYLDRRRAESLIENCMIVVAERVLGMADQEYRKIPENDQAAALIAVQETLISAQADSGDLAVRAALDAVKIENELVEQSRHVLPRAGLSADSERLYARALRESASQILEVSQILPDFQGRAIAETLRSQGKIIDQLRLVLDRLPKPSSDDDFSNTYRRQVVIQLNKLRMFGLVRQWSYTLSVAYIHLRAIDQSTGVAGRAEHVDSLFRSHRRLLLVGDAGSGKTTLLQWLAVRCARGELRGSGLGVEGAVPFLIQLRRYAKKALPTPDRFVEYINQHLVGAAPDGWVQNHLDRGTALVLIDGVDELPTGDSRESLVRWLSELMEMYPKVRYVVTSRAAALDEKWHSRSTFAVAEVQPLSWNDVQLFVRRWYSAAAIDADDEADRNQLAADERALLSAISGDRHLRSLTSNPLLCSMLCLLNKERRHHLPQGRMAVYAAALEMLLSRRDRDRGVVIKDELLLENQLVLLQSLAFWLVRNGMADAPIEMAREQIRRASSLLPRAITLNSEELLQYFLERSGILRQPVLNHVDFIHRVFQDYLAAKAVVDGDEMGLLLANVGNDQWADVLVLASGHASLPQSSRIIRTILRHAAASERPSRYQVLALACAYNSRQRDPSLTTELEAVVRDLIPPKDNVEAESVASAGEFVLDLLLQHPPTNIAEFGASVHAVALIGGEHALAAIAQLRTQFPEWHDELLSAWHYFVPSEFVAQVLTSPDVEALTVDTPTLLQSILPISGKIRSITIRSAESLLASDLPSSYQYDSVSLQIISHLSELQELMLEGDVASSFRVLPKLPPGLRCLKLVASQYFDLVGTSIARDVAVLHLIDCPVLFHDGELSKFPNVEELHLQRSGVSVQAVNSIPSLKRIRLVGMTDFPVSRLAEGIAVLANS